MSGLYFKMEYLDNYLFLEVINFLDILFKLFINFNKFKYDIIRNCVLKIL